MENWVKHLEEQLPEPTDTEPRLTDLSQVRAVVFDIYGTLLISASGDIDQAEISTGNLNRALKESNYMLLKNGDSKASLKYLLTCFTDIIRRHHYRQKNAGREFPEVDIRQVWEDLLDLGVREKIIAQCGECDPDRLTIIFELLSNKVYPMPGMKEIVKALHARDLALGIVSNAQFYTPVVMNYFLSGEIEEREKIDYFDPDLTVMSYTLLKAKPDRSLFTPVLEALHKKYGIAPEEAVMVGNDMYKDIYPAHDLGMKTILFAGDRRSLRLRKDKPEVKDLEPDAVITELKQLKQIFKL